MIDMHLATYFTSCDQVHELRQGHWRVVNNRNDIIFLTTHIYMRLSRTACQFLFVVQTGWVVSERGWYLHESIFK